MSVELITGYSGTPHISSDDQGHMHAGLLGGECYALDTGNGLELSMESANKATIATGDAVMYGRHVRVETPESVTIESGTQSQKRNDIVGLLYSKDASTGVESVAARVYRGTPTTGTPADPSYPTASILDGASEAFMPLWRVPLDGVSVGTPVKLFETSPTAASLQAQIESVRESVSDTPSSNQYLIVQSTSRLVKARGLVSFHASGWLRTNASAWAGVYTLPDGFAPPCGMVFMGMRAGSPVTVSITAAGSLRFGSAVNANDYFEFGVVYPAAG